MTRKFINDHEDQLLVGDKVVRVIAGEFEMDMRITQLDEETVTCGSWLFSRKTGFELDDELDWTETSSGSYLKEIYAKAQLS